MATVRYVGPHAGPLVVVHGDVEYEISPGEPADLPDDLVHGRPPAHDGDVGLEGLLAQGLDEHGHGTPQWELVTEKTRRARDEEEG
jgi:hypothetical protein